ncbi:MAG: hypothetical protein M1817_005442 [Caeruleum heppii]|nr:MAG: hypothetical protein M1817_005442 [Caeruleum heppii]
MASPTTTLETKEISLPSTSMVRVISMSECRAAAASLSEAFANDEVTRYPVYTADMAHYSESYKFQMHTDIMEYVTAAHILNGLVMTVGPNYASVAMWLPPGTEIDGWLTTLRSGLWRLYYKLSREGRRRFFAEFLPLLHHTKRDVLGVRDADSYYLVYLGTRPGEQRKGYGKALIQHVTEKADAEHRACYLESSAAKNNHMYKSHGFGLRKTIYLNYGARPVGMDIMVREPVVGPARRSGGAWKGATVAAVNVASVVDVVGVGVDKKEMVERAPPAA